MIHYYQRDTNILKMYCKYNDQTGVVISVYKGITDKEKIGINRFTVPYGFKPDGSIITRDIFISKLEFIQTKLTEYGTTK